MPRSAWRSLRPHQWIKNLLCLVPLVFTGHLADLPMVLGGLVAVAAFCLASGAVYLFNDLVDREPDRLHPAKRLRPIAAGEFQKRDAAICMLLLAAGAIGLAASRNLVFCAVIVAYLLQNVSYTCGLKRVVILDVMLVANGFLLRAAGGAFAINVTASPWLVLCTLTLALLVAFGKRRHELSALGDAHGHRSTLSEYSAEFLDQSMAISAAAALVMYSLFTLSTYAAATYGSHALVLSVPMVLYAVFRFIFLVRQERLAGDPSRLFVLDRPMLINGILWLLVCCYAIYGPSEWLPWWRFGYFEGPGPSAFADAVSVWSDC